MGSSACRSISPATPAASLSVISAKRRLQAQRPLVSLEHQLGHARARRLPVPSHRSEQDAASQKRASQDRRDALTLARLARSGDLVQVLNPDERDEAMRDLSRARKDAVRARHKARQQLHALLLRHGYRHTGAAHKRYLADLKLPHPARYTAFSEPPGHPRRR